MKKLLLIPLIFTCLLGFSQVTNRIQADSVKIYQVGGNGAELILENSSKNLTGAFLKNGFAGRTKFGYALDSVWLDSNYLKFRYGPNTLSFAITGINQQTLNDTASAIRLYIDTAFNNCEDKLLYGGSVTYMGEGYNFYVQDARYRKSCNEYVTDSGSVTMPPSDPMYDFFVLIYLDTDGQFHTRAGQPAESAKIPQAEGDEWALTAIKVTAGSTVPDFSAIYVYNENIEGWTVTNVGTTTDPNYASNPWIGSKSINITSWNNGDVIGLKRSAGTVNIANSKALSFAIQLKQTMVNAASVRATIYGNGIQLSDEYTVPLNKSSLGWQLISLPTDLLNLQSYEVDSIRLRYIRSGNSNVHAGAYLDNIHFINGFEQPSPGSIVQSVSVNAPPFITATVTPGSGHVVVNLTTPGSSSQLVHGDGVTRTDNNVKDVGAANSLSPDPRGARVQGNNIYFHDATDSTRGLFNEYYKKSVDTLKGYTVENLSNTGIPVMTSIDNFRTGFRTIVFSNHHGYTDSTVIVDTTGGVGGSSSMPGEGMSVSNDSIHLGGSVASPAIIYNERAINLNRKMLHLGSAHTPETGGDVWQWSYRSYSPLSIRSKDTITSNDMAYSHNMPVALLHAQRDLYYGYGGIRQYGIYGHRLAFVHYGRDSQVVRSDGGDYNQAFIGEQRFRSDTSYHGDRALFRTGHSSISSNVEGPSAVVGNTIVGNDVSGTRIYIKGQLNGIMSYLALQGMNADTVESFNYYINGSFVPNPGKVLRTSIYTTGPTAGNQVYAFKDGRGYKNWLSGTTVFGPTDSLTTDRVKIYGNLNMTDTLTVGTQTSVTDTTGMDVVMRRRSDGSYVKIRGDLLGIGGGGTPTLQQVLTAGSTLTGPATVVLDGKFSFTGSSVVEAPVAFNIKPSYTSDWVSALDFTGNGSSAYGSLSLREFSTGSGEFVELRAPLNITTTYGLNLPEGNDGDTIATKAYVRSVSGGSGANAALSNLSSVAINTSLVSDADNTDDLGSASVAWKNIYARQLFLNGSTSGAIGLNSDATGIAPIATTASGDGIIGSEMYAILQSNFGLQDVNTDQSAFPSTADVWTLQANTLYHVKGYYRMQKGNGNITTSIGFTAGGGASINWMGLNVKSHVAAAANGTSASNNSTDVDQLAATVVTASSATVNVFIEFEGHISVNAGGTFTPIIKYSTAPGTTGGTNRMGAGSYIKFTPIGPDSGTTIGNVN